MNDIQIFSNPDFGSVRTLEENGVILFCGADVAKALGYAKPQNALATHCKGALKRGILTAGGEQEMSFIPEADLYRLVFSSKLPTAEKFTDWVTETVLPSIRKHGAYMTPQTLQAAILNPDTMIQLCQQLKAEQVANQRLRENGYLIRDPKRSDYNMPTQRAVEQKLFEIKESTVVHSDGHTTLNKTPKVTGKGQIYFVNLFLKLTPAGEI